MIPLLVFALALSAVALTYELSPRARARLDDYLRALRGAHAAHRAADTHLAAARVAPDPMTALVHARAAEAANRAARQETASAARTAGPEPQKQAVSQSVEAVVAREDAIADVLTDAHLEVAAAVANSTQAVEQVHEAMEVNRESAQKTADAARLAQTEKERAAAAASATKVVARSNKIATALTKLGVGQCGVRSYAGVSEQVRDVLFARLHAEGMTVSGNNPWDVATHKYDVKLRAAWDPRTQVLKLVVTSGKGGYFGLVTCDEIWKKIDPIFKEVVGG